jgi:hypothetical protein
MTNVGRPTYNVKSLSLLRGKNTKMVWEQRLPIDTKTIAQIEGLIHLIIVEANVGAPMSPAPDLTMSSHPS